MGRHSLWFIFFLFLRARQRGIDLVAVQISRSHFSHFRFMKDNFPEEVGLWKKNTGFVSRMLGF